MTTENYNKLDHKYGEYLPYAAMKALVEKSQDEWDPDTLINYVDSNYFGSFDTMDGIYQAVMKFDIACSLGKDATDAQREAVEKYTHELDYERGHELAKTITENYDHGSSIFVYKDGMKFHVFIDGAGDSI